MLVSGRADSLTIFFPLWAQVIHLCCCFQRIRFLLAIGLCTCFVCSTFWVPIPDHSFSGARGFRSPLHNAACLWGLFETALRRIIQYEWTTLAFVSLPSFLAPASVISYLYTSNVWLQPVTYAGRLNLSSWLAISSSGGLSSRILGFALMTVCVCNPVSMSLGKNLMSYLVKRMFRENHMSHRQGNHFTNYMRKIFL